MSPWTKRKGAADLRAHDATPEEPAKGPMAKAGGLAG